MKKKRYYLTIITTALFFTGLSGDLRSWSFFQMLDKAIPGKAETEYLKEFNPERDIYFLPSAEDKTFFESINDLSICRDREIRKHIYLYLTRGKKFLKNAIIRSRRYLNIIEEHFRNDGDIPMEISLLPLLESGFNPYAVSRSRAVGMWQFIKGTSRSLGLKTDRWLDERRDIDKSTLAAIRHLKHLHRIFNSWELALMAYNGGAGRVRKAMARSRAKTFTELRKSKYLKRETKQYVPRFAALHIIYKNQQLFGIGDDIEETDPPKTEEFSLEYPADIRKIASLSDVPIQTIKKFNPELKRNYTPPYYKNYSIRIPVESIEKLTENREKLYRYTFKKFKKHIVKKGECLSKIAAKYNTGMKAILVLNGIKNPHRIMPGLKLYIPI